MKQINIVVVWRDVDWRFSIDFIAAEYRRMTYFDLWDTPKIVSSPEWDDLLRHVT